MQLECCGRFCIVHNCHYRFKCAAGNRKLCLIKKLFTFLIAYHNSVKSHNRTDLLWLLQCVIIPFEVLSCCGTKATEEAALMLIAGAMKKQ